MPGVDVREHFSLQGRLERVLRQRALHLELESMPHHLQGTQQRSFQMSSGSSDLTSFRLAASDSSWSRGWHSWLPSWRREWPDREAEDSDEDYKSADEVGEARRLIGERSMECHRYVSITAGGIALTLDKDKMHQDEPRTSCERLSDRQCRVSFSCHACSLGRETARIVLDVANGYVFTAAREIHWEVKIMWLRPKKGHDKESKAYSLVESIVTSGDLNGCLRGPEPSVVRMTLIPTDFQDLLGASHLYGFVLQFIDAHMGSVANPSQFHEHLAQLQSTVELHASHSFYKLVLSKRSTAFYFLTQVLGFLSGMSLVARVTYAAWLRADPKTRGFTSWLWTNPITKCVSAILCFCVTEEEEEEDAYQRNLIELDTSDLEMEAPKNPGRKTTLNGGNGSRTTQHRTKGDYQEIPQTPAGLPESISSNDSRRR